MSIESVYLWDLIDYGDFDFAKYHDGEINIITPALEKLGYTNVKFTRGESDSFGPLTRSFTATDSNGVQINGWYG